VAKFIETIRRFLGVGLSMPAARARHVDLELEASSSRSCMRASPLHERRLSGKTPAAHAIAGDKLTSYSIKILRSWELRNRLFAIGPHMLESSSAGNNQNSGIGD
jgi:hypothetical protein